MRRPVGLIAPLLLLSLTVLNSAAAAANNTVRDDVLLSLTALHSAAAAAAATNNTVRDDVRSLLALIANHRPHITRPSEPAARLLEHKQIPSFYRVTKSLCAVSTPT